MKNSIKDIALCAMFVAVISVCAQITFPLFTGVNFTLQTFAVALCGFVLECKRGLFCIIAYILLGISGAPVFSMFMSGPGVLLGSSGGFVFGFVFLCVMCGLSKGVKSDRIKAIAFITGALLLHISGTMYYSYITHTPMILAVVYVSLPFILKDILSVFAAYCLSKRVCAAGKL